MEKDYFMKIVIKRKLDWLYHKQNRPLKIDTIDEEHYVLIKRLMHQRDKTFINTYIEEP